MLCILIASVYAIVASNRRIAHFKTFVAQWSEMAAAFRETPGVSALHQNLRWHDMDMMFVLSVPGLLYIAAAALVSDITTFHESLGEAHGHEDFLVSEKGRFSTWYDRRFSNTSAVWKCPRASDSDDGGESHVVLGLKRICRTMDELRQRRGVFKAELQNAPSTPHHSAAFYAAREWNAVILSGARGDWSSESAAAMPESAELLRPYASDSSVCTTFGFIGFSTVGGGGFVPWHVGTSNFRLRFTLLVNASAAATSKLQVREAWESEEVSLPLIEEGDSYLWDDSKPHAAMNTGTEPRTILYIDFWRPELTDIERNFLSSKSFSKFGKFQVSK